VCVCVCVCVCVQTGTPLCALGSAHSDAHSDSYSTADPRRWYCPLHPARSAAGPCVRACVRACAAGGHGGVRSLLALCDIAFVGHVHCIAPACTRARALDRRRHGGEYSRVSCAHRAALRGGRADHCARRCAQGSRTARSTPTTARRASRRSSPRRRARVRPRPTAGRTAAWGGQIPARAAATTTMSAAAASGSTPTRRADPTVTSSRCAPVNPPLIVRARA
jgi:hypothetical protein